MERATIIAEIGQAHDGSLGILHSYIDAVAKTGVDAIKFQMHIAEAESSEYEPFRVNFSYEDDTRYNYWKRMEFTFEQWQEIKRHCEDVGVEFLCSPFSLRAVDLMEELDVKRYKIGSGEVNNFLMLERIAKTGKGIILSSGMSSYSELDETINFLQKFDCEVSVLQCTTKYPTQAEDIGLNVLDEMKQRYNVPVGLSDHSGTIFPSLAAVSLGASLVEVHVVFDRRMFGPDAKSSLQVDELKLMVEGVRSINVMKVSEIDKNNNTEFSHLKKIFEKSLAVNRDLSAGDAIKLKDLEAKKPAEQGIPAKDYRLVIGRKLVKDKAKWEFLKEEDLDEK